MIGRPLFLAAAAALLSLTGAACGGDDSPASLPETGAAVCNDLKDADRFRYVLSYSIQSPQQESPPDDSTGVGFALLPSMPALDFQTKHDGAMVKPDRLDFKVSLPNQPSQPPLHTIRIGDTECYFLNDTWQVNTGGARSFPFTPPNLCDAFVSPLSLAGKGASQESVSDTEARHVRLEGVTLDASSQIFSSESDMGRLLKSFDVDVWLNKTKSRLVKVDAVSRASYPYGRELSVTFDLEVKSYNDDSIKIDPPIS